MRNFLVVVSILCVAVMVLLSSCTTIYTPEDYCVKPVDPTMARIELRRKGQFVGGGHPMKIFDNAQPIGAITGGEKLCWDRYPGKAQIDIEGNKYERDVVAGTAYYFVFRNSRKGLIFETDSSPKE